MKDRATNHKYSTRRKQRHFYSTQRLVYNSLPKCETITANFTGVTRMDRMEGKDYLVAPMIMMVEGVHAGSNGPLYYPEEELAKIPAIWNHKPVIVYHPAKGSACDPDILTNRKIGVIMNTVFEDGKLKAEAWLEPARMKKVDKRIADAIKNNQTMELSTGLYTDNEQVEEGEWNGEKYEYIARNYRPDHLALLPDIKGACSVADGAGFLRLNEAGDNIILDITSMQSEEREYVLSGKNGIIARLNARLNDLVRNEMSHSSIRGLLGSLLRIGGKDDLWIEDIYDDFFIYEIAGQLHKQGYTAGESSVAFIGDKELVIRVTEYRTMSGNFIGNERKENAMLDKKQKVDAIIANAANQWAVGDEEKLMALNDETLDKILPVENAEENKSDVQNAAEKGAQEITANSQKEDDDDDDDEEQVSNMSAEDFITNKVPTELQDVFRTGLLAHNADKQKLIGVITKNKNNTFTTEQLKVKGLDELRGMAQLAASTDKQKEIVATISNYAAQAEVVDNEDNKEEPMGTPTMNFGDTDDQKA